MNPEQALVLIVALLWGPTMLWLIIRYVRGPRESNRRIGMGDDARDAAGELIWPSPGVKELAELVDQSEFWVCEACRSINRPGTKRCYACRLKRGDPVPVRESDTAQPQMVPVMARPDERRPEARPGKPVEGQPAPAERPLAPVASAYVAGQWVATASTKRAPGAATGPAPSSARNGTATAPAGTPASGVAAGARARAAAQGGPVADPMVPTATPTVPAAAVPAVDVAATATSAQRQTPGGESAAGVCPFVRLEGDPTTWYDFPHPGNLCHALTGEPAPRRGGLAGLFGGRLGGSRPEVTTPEVQATLCLTAAHVQCARYKAGRASAPRPSGSAEGNAVEPGVTPAVVPIVAQTAPGVGDGIAGPQDTGGRESWVTASAVPVETVSAVFLETTGTGAPDSGDGAVTAPPKSEAPAETVGAKAEEPAKTAGAASVPAEAALPAEAAVPPRKPRRTRATGSGGAAGADTAGGPDRGDGAPPSSSGDAGGGPGDAVPEAAPPKRRTRRATGGADGTSSSSRG